MHDTIMGMQLERLRKARGLSQDEVAAAVNTSQTTIHRAEKGARSITLGLLYDLADYYGVPIVDLFEPPERPAPLKEIDAILKTKRIDQLVGLLRFLEAQDDGDF